MRKPVVGMTTAIVSRNAVVSHWAVAAVMSSSRMSSGRATPMIVSFRMTTKAATTRRAMTAPGRTAGFAVAPGGAVGTVPVETMDDQSEQRKTCWQLLPIRHRLLYRI